jgi:hypothetical protein
MKYAIYKEDPGPILRIVNDYAWQVGVGENYLEFSEVLDDSTHYVKAGKLVKYPSKPSIYCTFNYATDKWSDDRTKEDVNKQALIDARKVRDHLLKSTDWVILKAFESDCPPDKAWLDYRQALRDITLQEDLLNIIWPESPK